MTWRRARIICWPFVRESSYIARLGDYTGTSMSLHCTGINEWSEEACGSEITCSNTGTDVDHTNLGLAHMI